MVLFKSDGTPTYHFASVIDDIDLGINCIIRGIDHLSNTIKHITLYDILDVDPPNFYHTGLIHNMKGKKIVYECQDSITGEKINISHGKIIKFNLGVCDVKVYNKIKTASRDEDVHFYKNFLSPWLKNEPRESPLVKQEEKEKDKNLGYEALLRLQSEYYDWTEGSIITESLLGEDRKAD